MGKLKEYLELYEKLGVDELTIIEKYISDFNLESEFNEMAIRLAANQLQKERHKFSRAQLVVESVGSHHRASYTKKEDKFIDALLKLYAFDQEKLKQYVEEKKDVITNMLRPDFCWINMIAFINLECGMRFKDQKEDMEYIPF